MTIRTLAPVIAVLLAFGPSGVRADATSAADSDVRRYLIRHANDAVCRTFPCWNWVGVDVASGRRIVFDRPTLPAGTTLEPGSPLDVQTRLFGLLVEASFGAVPNRPHLEWAPTLRVVRIVEPPAESPAPSSTF